MGKQIPEERWRVHVEDRVAALRLSGELDRLREKGLAILGRKKRYTVQEWWKTFSKRASSKEYRDWQLECEAVGQRFGLASWTIYLLCLVSGYEPEKGRLPIEADWPNVTVVTENDNPDFCARLAFEVQSRGFQIVQQVGQTEIPLVSIPLGDIPPLPTNKPPARNAFRIRVETPMGYPPEAAYHLEQMKSQLERDLLSALGYSVKKRLRRSPLVSKAEALQVGSQKLPKRGLYDIVVKNYRPGSAKKDEERAKLIKSRRHSLRKRLIEPYEHDKKTE